MYRSMPLLVFLGLLLAACSPHPQPIPPTPTSASSPTSLHTATLQMTPVLQVLTETPTQVPSNTLPPPAVSPTMDLLLSTAVAQLGPLEALTNISQYYYPIGVPLKIWRDVPVMPEAVSGQEFPPYVYSYTAKASLDQSRQFYALLTLRLGITDPAGSGNAGTGAQAIHDVTFFSPQLMIVLTSFDLDPGHVIVVIAKLP
jgi:hypothetical protein